MQRSRPLPVTNPEFSITEFPGFREYRVENWRLARDGSTRVIKGASGLTWRDALGSLFLSLIWPKVGPPVFNVSFSFWPLTTVIEDTG